jgi:hypothetical protein
MISTNGTTYSLYDKLKIPKDVYDKLDSKEITPADFSSIIKKFQNNNNINEKFEGLIGIRKLLTIKISPPIQELIDYGIIKELQEMLNNEAYKDLYEFQYEILWCLTNIATGTSNQEYSIISRGGLPKIISLLDSPIEEIRIQNVWVIGNLATDSDKIREILFREKAYDKILTTLTLCSESQKELIKNCCWAISNFCRVKPEPPYEYIQKSIHLFCKAFLILPHEPEYLTEICFTLSFITEHYKNSFNDLFKMDIIKHIINCLDMQNDYILLSCLRIVGNIATGNANQTQLLLDWGILNKLSITIFNPKKNIRKESAWICSNIAAGTQRQIETLIENDFLLIFQKSFKEDEIEIKREIIWAISNLTSVEKEECLEKILKQGILNTLGEVLKWSDAKYLAVGLEALNNLLAYGKKRQMKYNIQFNEIVMEIDKMGLSDVLENLQYHPVEIVYEKTKKLIENYFETVDEEEI